MTTNEQNRITPGQLAFLIFHSQLGQGILALPYAVYSVSKADGWISTLLAGVGTQLIILIMWAVGKRFPSATLYEILPRVFGKTLGTLLKAGYILYFILMGVLIVDRFGSILEKWAYPKTPSWAIYLLMIALCMYLVREPLRTIARFYVLVNIPVAMMFVIAAYSYTKANLLYLLPIGQAGWTNIFKGSIEATDAMLGFEILLVVYPFVEGGSKEIVKAASIGNALSTLLYTFMVLTSLAFFSPPVMALVPEPVLYMLRALTFELAERPDLYFLTIWMVVVTTAIMSNMFMAATGIARMFGAKNHRHAVTWVAILSFFLALWPQDPFQLDWLSKSIVNVSYVFTLAIPLVILVIASSPWIRNRRGVQS
ncbi:GerAB/ArcD/ProY family transporter [Brevibacillus brevis]|uniref:GerAB/ArcD/ProY family transporter n=1 Tax=Brevibacillus brevis TaxID=1393 RepID=A0ABY9T352_BREBE|nr:GerAB/ArcD/ProY family transporter [Brevibacillus brevis]WNC14343.1 GerAB/ArcD/ProY family transporter [Brevibacillus brevis]